MPTPMLKEGDVISIGSFKHAVVCSITGLEKNFCEAVYLDNRGKAINEDVRWNGTTWEFVHSGPCGGYADQSTRLAPYVRKLKSL